MNTPPAASNAGLWRTWRDWKARKKQELGVTQSSSKMEESLASDDVGRVHIHWKVNLKNPLDNASKAVFSFHGVKPDVRVTRAAQPQAPALGVAVKAARGASLEEASNRGHFYTWAWKKGSLYRGTNWHPWKDYRVQGKWLDDLWTDDKLGP